MITKRCHARAAGLHITAHVRFAGVAFLLALLTSIGMPGLSCAEAPSSIALEQPRAKPTFLVLGFHEDGIASPVAREAVAHQILATTLGVALVPQLPTDDLLCVSESCMEQLTSRFRSADFMLGGAVLSDPENHRHIVHVWLHAVNSSLPNATSTHRYLEQACERCSAEQKVAMLVDILLKLLEPTPKSAAQLALPSTVAPMSGSCIQQSHWNFTRAFVLGSASGLMASGLAMGISMEVARDSRVAIADSRQSTFFSEDLHQTEFATGGFIAATLAVVPLALSLFYPRLFLKRGQDADVHCLEVSKSRWTAGRAGAAGTFAGLLAFTLPLTIIFSASRCPNCGGIPINPFSQVVAPAWGITGAWALGFTLSMLIPTFGGGTGR